MLRKVIVKIRLERIDMQKGVKIEILFDNSITRLAISSEFVRKQRFKLKKIERPRNVDNSFNKKKPIEHMVKMNIYYQRHREKTEIDMIGK